MDPGSEGGSDSSRAQVAHFMSAGGWIQGLKRKFCVSFPWGGWLACGGGWIQGCACDGPSPVEYQIQCN